MKRVMLRLDDELYQRLFEAAHDDRKSINAFVTQIIAEKVGS